MLWQVQKFNLQVSCTDSSQQRPLVENGGHRSFTGVVPSPATRWRCLTEYYFYGLSRTVTEKAEANPGSSVVGAVSAAR